MASSTHTVTVTATNVVHSQHPVANEDPFVLGPIDQLLHFATPVSAVWVYESPDINAVPLERLRKALSRVLDYYPHLTGRLCIDETGLRSINRLGTGVHLVEASYDAPFRSFAGRPSATDEIFSICDFPACGNPLLSPWDVSLEGAQRGPLFTIQRTQFACSAVAVGMRLSHVVGGAGSFLRLYQDFAEIYRGLSLAATGRPVELARPPHLQPFMVDDMLHMDADEKDKALSELPNGYSLSEPKIPEPAFVKNEAEAVPSKAEGPPIGRSVRFSKSAVTNLKQLAVDPNDSGSRASTFTALTAHLWQRIHLARLAHARSQLEDMSTYSHCTYGTSVDFSSHLGLPEHSFGNTAVSKFMELSSSKLEKAPLWEISKAINDLVRDVSVGETRKLGRWIAAQPQKSRIQLDFNVGPSTLITTGWHRFPFYDGAELDVPPLFASPVPMEALFDGMVLFTQPKNIDGGVDALILLKASTWALLDTDKEFVTMWEKTS